MQPLIDSDIFLYEVAFAAEKAWDKPGYPPFDYVAEMLDNRIDNICAIVEATKPPILYMTGKGNFRYEIAKRQPYKVRPSDKPFHYKNLKAYIQCKYDTIISEGMEADDLMAIEQTRVDGILDGNPFYSGPSVRTIICTRDKDLRQVPGMHYGWEMGMQPSFGPMLVDVFGDIRLSSNRKKLSGYGEKFFYAQCLMGDRVDSIPGLDGMGAVGTFELLQATQTSEEAFKAVLGAYKGRYGDEQGPVELLEQGRLLWMTRGLHEDGSPILWELPIGNQIGEN